MKRKAHIHFFFPSFYSLSFYLPSLPYWPCIVPYSYEIFSKYLIIPESINRSQWSSLAKRWHSKRFTFKNIHKNYQIFSTWGARSTIYLSNWCSVIFCKGSISIVGNHEWTIEKCNPVYLPKGLIFGFFFADASEMRCGQCLWRKLVKGKWSLPKKLNGYKWKLKICRKTRKKQQMSINNSAKRYEHNRIKTSLIFGTFLP